MRTGEKKKPLDPDVARGLYRAAVASALVAGAFVLVGAALLLANWFRNREATPLDNPDLAARKAALAEDPKNEALKAEIRALDHRLRVEHFRRQDQQKRGGWMLLAGGSALAVALKSAAALRKKLPHPSAEGPAPDVEARLAALARGSVALVAALLAAGAGILALRGGPVPVAPPAEDETWPSDAEVRRNWPSFRGPGGLGVATAKDVPDAWDGKTGRGILWKTAVPLPGFNSPVVWGNRVFLTGADRKRREVYAFDGDSGALLWTAAIEGVPGSPTLAPKVGDDTGYACPTAVTDGRRVYAIFANGDVAAVDYEGRRVWARNLGVPQSTYGYASSLAIWRNRVLVLWDQTPLEEGKSKLIALSTLTGRTVWETRRPVRDSWASPVVAAVAGREQVVAVGDPWLIAYDPADGRERWRAKVAGGDVAPSPTAAADLVFAVQPYAKLVAVRADGAGDVTKTHVAWKAEDNVPDICSPLAAGDWVMTLTTQGMLTCFGAADGKKRWAHDFEEDFYVSPTLAGDRVCLVAAKGTTIFLAAGAAEFKELGRANLGEPVHASPAVLDGRIYMRGHKHLYAIGKR